ncbi:MAG: DUF86 domain-containing protein [Methanocalculus sp.]|uniref:HepT-like ribonuclease domain-containing protein n=1 Tax=Methanocalculus sp. TaxID=2004547 RepID=UPI0027212253|nr:HepT-like ribonuclease domain-containing protein [Methanocalculus sp.]MDO9540081.1 DUF86 domain-containing protein [Methanocalculus sp.]
MKRDDLFLGHILEEIAFLRLAGEGLTYDGLLDDPIRQRAIIRSIEIIGEATKNLSQKLKDEHTDIPWKLIAGSRDKMIHAYFDIDWRIVWNILTHEIPDLDEKMKNIL